MSRAGLWDVVNFTHRGFGEKSKKGKYPYNCKDEHEVGASSEMSCIWGATFSCVRDLGRQGGDAHGRGSLEFQTCMERGWSSTMGPVYVPYGWVEPSNSKKGHAPYRASNYTLQCLAATTNVSAASLATCLGLDGTTDAFLGSPGHALLMQEYAYSDAAFKRAKKEEAGPSIFIQGSWTPLSECAEPAKDPGDAPKLPAKCRYLLLDRLCDEVEKAGSPRPAGCAHDE